jgi:hypothetical protein
VPADVRATAEQAERVQPHPVSPGKGQLWHRNFECYPPRSPFALWFRPILVRPDHERAGPARIGVKAQFNGLASR